jgi:hypothetical protein
LFGLVILFLYLSCSCWFMHVEASHICLDPIQVTHSFWAVPPLFFCVDCRRLFIDCPFLSAACGWRCEGQAVLAPVPASTANGRPQSMNQWAGPTSKFYLDLPFSLFFSFFFFPPNHFYLTSPCLISSPSPPRSLSHSCSSGCVTLAV